MNLAKIQEAMQEDDTLRVLQAPIKIGLLTSDHLKPSKPNRPGITVDHANKIILRSTRIILPDSLREHAKKLAQVGHHGQLKTTALLPEYLWFPNIGQSVKCFINRSIPCQAKANAPE